MKREPHKRDEPTAYRDPGPIITAASTPPIPRADMNETAKLHRGTVKGLLYADGSALPPLRARVEIARSIEPWAANVAHWGKSTIDQKTIDGPNLINGIPHKTIARELDPETARAVAKAHNIEVAALLSRTVEQEWRDALKALVTAWEALPTGHYSPREVERWLKDYMKPAIDAGRAILDRTLPAPPVTEPKETP